MNMTQEKELKPEPYITIPRYIKSELRNRKITHREYELYLWIRLDANPYGIATMVSAEAIIADLPSFKSTDFMNKVLRDGMLPMMDNTSSGLFRPRLIARTMTPIVP